MGTGQYGVEWVEALIRIRGALETALKGWVGGYFQIFDSQPVWPLATRGNAVQRAMVRAQDADCSSRLVAMVVGTKEKQ